MKDSDANILKEKIVAPVHNPAKAYVALFAISIIWGSTWVVSKIGVQGIPGFQLAAIRQFCAGTIFLTFFKIKREPFPTFLQFKWLTVLSLFMIVFANGISTWSIKYIPSGLGALIGTMFPLCVVIIEMVFFKNSPNNRLTIIGMLLGFAGLFLVFYQNAFQPHQPGYLTGVIVSFLSTVSWSIGTIFIARKQLHMNPYNAIGWQMFIGSFFIAGMALFTHNYIPLAQVSLKTWLTIIYLILFGSVAAFIGMIYTLKHLPVAIGSLYAYFNPIVAMLIGAVVLAEPLTLPFIGGSLITLAGVYIVSRSVRK